MKFSLSPCMICPIIIIIIIIISSSSSSSSSSSIVFSGTAAQRGLWLPRPRGSLITHNNVPQSLGLLWTSDQLVAETSTCQTHNNKTSMPPVGFETTIAAGERS
jgi:hypothetical protein